MTGGIGDPLIQDADTDRASRHRQQRRGPRPNGTNGPDHPGQARLLTNANAPIENQLYEGWLYALVVNTNDTLNGLYVTKDFGENWTKVAITTADDAGKHGVPGTPSNNPTDTAVNIVGNYERHRQHQPGEPRPGDDGRPDQSRTSSTSAARVRIA